MFYIKACHRISTVCQQFHSYHSDRIRVNDYTLPSIMLIPQNDEQIMHYKTEIIHCKQRQQ